MQPRGSRLPGVPFLLAFPLTALVALVFVWQDASVFLDRPVDRGQIAGRDFLLFWGAGKLAAQARFDELYAPDGIPSAVPSPTAGRADAYTYFAYPPHLLLALRPLARLPYARAWFVWSAAGLLALLSAAGGPRLRVVLLLLSPAVLVSLEFGQTGLFTGALLLAGIRLLDRRPALAGLCFGLLTIKPQLGVLVPFALVAGRHHRALLAAVATVVACALATLLALGPAAFAAWLSADTFATARGFLEHGSGAGLLLSPTVFVALRPLGIGVAYAAQAAAALLALAGVVIAFRRRHPLAGAALVVGGTLASPYLHNYDLVAYGAVVAALALRGGGPLVAVAWTTPIAVLYLAQAGLPVAPLVHLALFAAIVLGKTGGAGPESRPRLA